MELSFTVAKKFSPNNIKGLELRSASLERAVVFNTSGKGYEKVREAYDAYLKEAGKDGREVSLKLKGIGKSYEISGPDTMDFLGHINFVNESHNEFVDFFRKAMPEIGKTVSLELTEKAALIEVTAEAESFEKYSDELLPIIEKYDIGIFKK